MLHSDLFPLVHTKPFKPFRITMTEGDTYDVWHREGFFLTQTMMHVGLLPSSDGGTYARGVVLDLFSVTSVEYLSVPAKLGGNGQPS